jgi:hypothetical protein
MIMGMRMIVNTEGISDIEQGMSNAEGIAGLSPLLLSTPSETKDFIIALVHSVRRKFRQEIKGAKEGNRRVHFLLIRSLLLVPCSSVLFAHLFSGNRVAHPAIFLVFQLHP